MSAATDKIDAALKMYDQEHRALRQLRRNVVSLERRKVWKDEHAAEAMELSRELLVRFGIKIGWG